MAQKTAQEKDREFRITGVPGDMQKVVRRAAKYYGTDVSSFLKLQLRQVVDGLPIHVKEFRELE